MKIIREFWINLRINKKIKRVKFSNKLNLDFRFDFEFNNKIKNYKGKI